MQFSTASREGYSIAHGVKSFSWDDSQNLCNHDYFPYVQAWEDARCWPRIAMAIRVSNVRTPSELQGYLEQENIVKLEIKGGLPEGFMLGLLGNMKVLVLSKAKEIIDVSALGSVRTLDLSFCTGITDVSALGRVHTLYLRGCTGIKDVSALVALVGFHEAFTILSSN